MIATLRAGKKSEETVRVRTQISLLPPIFLSVFLVLTALRAHAKPFWYDELLTLYTARLGSIQGIWTVETSGLDLNPPLIYLSTWAAQFVAGEGGFVTRLPALAGFILLLWAVYRFIEYRLGADAALAGAIFLALSGAYPFAYEARPYALVLGFSGLALLFWQRAAANVDRTRSLVGLSLSIAAALLSHCYAVMLFLPLGLGELTRLRSRRRVDWPMLASLAASCIVLALYFPLLATSRKMILKGPLFDPLAYKIFTTYALMLSPVVAPVAVLLAIGWALARKGHKALTSFEQHESAAAYVFILLPLVVFVASLVVHGGYFPRYSLMSVIGFALLFSEQMARLFGRTFRYPLLVPCVLGAFFILSYLLSSKVSAASVALPDGVPSNETVVIADGQTFLELGHYLDEANASRLVFAIDRESALQYMKTDCYDRSIQVIRKLFPSRGALIKWEDLPKPPFFVYGLEAPEHSWLLQRLKSEGAIISDEVVVGL